MTGLTMRYRMHSTRDHPILSKIISLETSYPVDPVSLKNLRKSIEISVEYTIGEVDPARPPPRKLVVHKHEVSTGSMPMESFGRPPVCHERSYVAVNK